MRIYHETKKHSVAHFIESFTIFPQLPLDTLKPVPFFFNFPFLSPHTNPSNCRRPISIPPPPIHYRRQSLPNSLNPTSSLSGIPSLDLLNFKTLSL
ncbi:hypothetical protein L1887_23517 [Cichorium endivia]|nr:hypothetical protein L1887_23517 [Cichorium endivia]